ncbi:MAG: hypothetical protein F4213_05680 [Boseongicola sp. SB0677_bin_26]|nr:hypothetical protein [Boseongicola sp. SB0665_bin_10]MYG25497.1 hypothetical protein [Boseongicola sp. SB0677_bin_26]
MSFRALVDQALPKWHDLTGVMPDQTQWKIGEFDIEQMNRAVMKALKMEPDGITAYFLLECFLRHHLEEKSFTVASIMKDYAALQEYLAKARDLFVILQGDVAAEHSAVFRQRVKEGLALYGADSKEALELVDDNDVLPFLRRDALHSMHALTPYQFLAGDFGEDPKPGLVQRVYQAWSINDLLPAMRDMRMSGIAVVLVRDPMHAEQSFFGFAMRNGQNVVFFTDRTKPAFPGQEDRMRGRGRGRQFMRQMWSNHFPYELLKPEWNEKGDVSFVPSDELAPHGQTLVPMMPIGKLQAHQAIWLTMVLALLSARFWKQRWQAKELSYTGDMVTNQDLLVMRGGRTLPVAKGYQPLGLSALTLEDISREKIARQTWTRGGRKTRKRGETGREAGDWTITTDVNKWLEDRYAHTVAPEIINQWTEDRDTMKMLPPVNRRKRHWPDGKREKPPENALAATVETRSRREASRIASWERPVGYTLQTFTNSMFGSRDELEKDRAFIGRHSLAMDIQREADREYEARRDSIVSWYRRQLEGNVNELARRAAKLFIVQRGTVPDEHAGRRVCNEPILREVADKAWRDWLIFSEVTLGDYCGRRDSYLCVFDGTVASWKCVFRPWTAEDLADLTARDDPRLLPDVLRHWQKEKDYVGNSILERIDPVESEVSDPWMQMNFNVSLFMSRRAMNRIVKKISNDTKADGLVNQQPPGTKRLAQV